jgi:RNA 2',3'-cyclic 3'-phosphodiesterase
MKPSAPSPCVRNCCLNDQDVCLGCLRTLPEILNWHRYSPEERDCIFNQLAERRAAASQAVSPPATQGRAVSPVEKRCFIGIALDAKVRTQLTQHAAELRHQVPGILYRWIAPENYHITLQFLGNVAADQRDALMRVLSSTAWLPRPLSLEVNQIGGFPSPQQSRFLVAHIVPTEALSALQARLQATLGSLGFKSEHQAFRPHITLARPKRDQHQTDAPAQAIAPMAFQVQTITLFESRQTPSGSVYHDLGVYV